MPVLIKNLAPELQELAHQRQREQGNDGTFDGRLSASQNHGNFLWEKTPERELWIDIDLGKDVTNHPKYPTPVVYSIF